jgi:hypothetical protein
MRSLVQSRKIPVSVGLAKCTQGPRFDPQCENKTKQKKKKASRYQHQR